MMRVMIRKGINISFCTAPRSLEDVICLEEHTRINDDTHNHGRCSPEPIFFIKLFHASAPIPFSPLKNTRGMG